MDEDLRVNHAVSIPGNELWFTASRSSGPGGQNVNKTSSRVSLHWNFAETQALSETQRERARVRLGPYLDDAGVVHIHASESRSQRQNLLMAKARLAEALKEALRPIRKRIPTQATRASREHRLEDKHRRSTAKRQREDPAEE